MKKNIFLLTFISIFLFNPMNLHGAMVTQLEHETDEFKHIAQPPYAKWGEIAIEKTKEKYPKAEIVDYEHLGRINGVNTTMERFKLILKEGEKEFGVIVQIEYDKQTEKIIKVSFREVEK